MAFIPLRTGDDLDAITRQLPYLPTQREVYAANVNDYATAMDARIWDWRRTATDPRAPMTVDSRGAIVAGHHRFLAAAVANITIPAGVIKVLPGVTARPVRPWRNVVVFAGYRP